MYLSILKIDLSSRKNKAIGIRNDLPLTQQDSTNKRTSSFFFMIVYLSVSFFFSFQQTQKLSLVRILSYVCVTSIEFAIS